MKKLLIALALLAVSYSCKKENPRDSDSTYFLDIPFAEDAKIPSDMAVDMGTGVLWRSGNLGTAYADQNGDYYAWGEVKPYYLDTYEEAPAETVKWAMSYSGYNWNSYYKFTSDKGKTFSKYKGLDDATLLPEDDAAHMVLGGKWRMPTLTEWQQLIQNSTVTPVTLRGRNGFKITSVKYPDHYIFLPFTGYRSQQNMERTIDATWNGRWSFTEAAVPKNGARGTIYCYKSSPFKAGTLRIDLNKDKSMPITMSAILYDGTKIALRLNAYKSCG